jgi:hypothetical protein
MRLTTIHISLILGLAVLLPSCLPQTTEFPSPTEDQVTPYPTPTAEDTGQSSSSGELDGEPNPLAPEPLDVVFFSEDGIELQGRFFPAATLDQPVVVLMHWYQGDQGDWEEIAYWLQNRGSSGSRRGVPWLDPGWFPDLPPNTSYNILTFTFRECEGGCSQLSAEEWLRDARASLAAARSLEGVNPNQVIAVGASIGGDAAISSCAAALKIDPQACLGALSLSPGSYLGEDYPDLVALLENATPPHPAWCLYDEADPDAVVCEKAIGIHYHKEGWQGGNLHGMHLINSSLDPLPLLRVVEFLELVTEN